jgi:hypothetical protein
VATSVKKIIAIDTTNKPSVAGTKVMEYRPDRRESGLQAHSAVKLRSGLVLKDWSHFQKSDGSRWVSPPRRKFCQADHSTGWSPYIEFRDKAIRQKFQDLVLDAIDLYVENHPDLHAGSSFEAEAWPG